MRKSAVLVGLATTATVAALLVQVDPANASTARKVYGCATAYGEIDLAVSYNSAGGELQYDAYTPIKIASKTFVDLFFRDQGFKTYGFPSNNGGAGGTWHYWNATDHPTARAAHFEVYIGPVDNRWVCDTTLEW